MVKSSLLIGACFAAALTAGPAGVAQSGSGGVELAWSTYLGGEGSDQATGVATDAEGNAYVVGRTIGGEFPVTPDAYDPGGHDAGNFVCKFNPAGELIYSSYLEHGYADGPEGIAVSPAGDLYAISYWTLTKLSPSGQPLWTVDLGGGHRIRCGS